MDACTIKVLPSSLLEKISLYLPQEDYINLACVSRLFASIYCLHDGDYWWFHFPQQVMMKYRTSKEKRFVAKFYMYWTYYTLNIILNTIIPEDLRNIASLWWCRRSMQNWIPFGQNLIRDDNCIILMVAIVPDLRITKIACDETMMMNKNYDTCFIINTCYDRKWFIGDAQYREIVYDIDKKNWDLHAYNIYLTPNYWNKFEWIDNSLIVKRYIIWSYLRLLNEYNKARSQLTETSLICL